ncbi:MAG TPA: ABC transporter permease [Chloroflexota bacterium]|nr:ABC transporter permease [Chloroflexota bacterium]
MWAYATRRILQAIPVVFLSTVLVFLLLHLLPGDPAMAVAGSNATPRQLAAVRHDMGLDEPLPLQYWIWLQHLAHGNLGRSVLSGQQVSLLLSQRIPATMELALAGMVLSLAVSLVTGIVAALNQRKAVDWVIMVFNSLALAIPQFWMGILLIIVLAVVLGWLPPGGRVASGSNLGASLKSLAMPAIALALPLTGGLSRYIRASMLEVLYEDHIRTARSKGLAERAVIYAHALRNALLPVVTVLGLQFGFLLGGTVIIESVFSWPGLGTLMLDAIGNRDYVVVQAGLLYLAIVFILLNLVTDLLYGFLDPRIRSGSG